MENNKNKVNLENIDEFIKDIDSKIKNVEEKELDDKSPEEQQQLKEQWEKERLKNTEKLKKELEKFEKEREKWNENQNNLMPVEDIKTGLNDMEKELDDKWNETLRLAIDDLCKDNTPEEREKIIKTFNDINGG